MNVTRSICVVVTGVLATGALNHGAAVAAAEGLVTEYVTVEHSCSTRKNSTVPLQDHPFNATVRPETLSVRYPKVVAPGEVFTAYVQPGAMASGAGGGGGFGLGRLSYDIAFPANATNLAASLTGGATGFTSSPTIMAVDRVSAAGARQADGSVARIWGGEAVDVSNSNDGTWQNNWQGGLQVPGGSSFRLPEVALQMRAPVAAAGSTLDVGLKAAGVPTGSMTDQKNNTLQGAQKAGFVSAVWYYTLKFYCSSSANAAHLTSTFVDGALPTYRAKTETSMNTPASRLPVDTLTATVSTNEELMSNVRAGMMSFTIRSRATGAVVDTVRDVAIAPDGTASTRYRFPGLTASNPREDFDVTATYSGTPNDIEASTSTTASLTVGYNEIAGGVALTSSNGELANGGMPVTLKAGVTMPNGKSFPNGMQVRLLRDGRPVGEPVTVPGGGTGTKQMTFPVDRLTQAEQTRTYRYTAELVPLVVNDVDRYSGATAAPVAAIVTGSNPDSTVPEGGTGSVSLEGFFKAPQLVWDWMTGSIGQAGRFSVGFAK